MAEQHSYRVLAWDARTSSDEELQRMLNQLGEDGYHLAQAITLTEAPAVRLCLIMEAKLP